MISGYLLLDDLLAGNLVSPAYVVVQEIDSDTKSRSFDAFVADSATPLQFVQGDEPHLKIVGRKPIEIVVCLDNENHFCTDDHVRFEGGSVWGIMTTAWVFSDRQAAVDHVLKLASLPVSAAWWPLIGMLFVLFQGDQSKIVQAMHQLLDSTLDRMSRFERENNSQDF